jgi:methylmalonyl-CoA/ethylmalonyl-CoA epimerase
VTDVARAGRTADVLASVGAVYDHVAHAVPSIAAALPLYRDLLGGVVCSGGISSWGGHLAVIVEYGTGARIELLEPVRRDAPSIGNFLAASPRGGLHHVTFKVPDIEAALERVAPDQSSA